METRREPRRLIALLAALVIAAGTIGLAAVALGGPEASVAPGSPSPSAAVVVVTPSPTPSPTPTAAPTASPTPSPTPTAAPTPTPGLSDGTAVATRVVVPALGIDLPVVKSPPVGVYPYCSVAMRMGRPFGQPGGTTSTYLFAHARDGMFGPIYKLVMVKKTPDKLVGMTVEVYTDDSLLHTYRITKVLPHQTSLARPASATTDELWLQTSEGPKGTKGKTQVLAVPVSVTQADPAAAHPKAHIVHCG